MKNIILSLIGIASVVPVFADGTNQLSDEKSRVSYAIGVSVGMNFKHNAIEVDDAMFLRGVQDVQNGGTLLLSEQDIHKVLTDFQVSLRQKQQKLAAELGAKNKADGAAFLAANKNNPGVVTLPDGLQYLVLTNGTGAKPAATDTVEVNYRGTLLDGSEFDSSYKRGKPATFPVNRVIPGWTEALQKMSVGSKWKLFIPSDLAYGPQGRPGTIPPSSTLLFEVELLSVKPAAPRPPMPASAPLTSDIIKVPSAEEMKNGAKIEVIKSDDAQKMQSPTNQ